MFWQRAFLRASLNFWHALLILNASLYSRHTLLVLEVFILE